MKKLVSILKMLYSVSLVLFFTTTADAQEAAPIRGFADLHNHQFAHDAFGGKMLSGKSFSDTPGGIADALSWCTDEHGAGGLLDPVGMALGQGIGHPVGGWPQFDGWPKRTTITHQQMYFEWVKRAFDGGLKLMVVLAVNNETLCNMYGPKPGFTCNDMDAVDRQISDAYALQGYTDNLSGGPGQGWYRIVKSPAEARQAINNGQMAVVLGIEVDSLFNCGVSSNCTADQIKTGLESYYQKGVRHFFPVHLFNNAYGGAAIYDDAFNIGNKFVTGDFFQTYDCSPDGYEFKLLNGSDPLTSAILTFLGISYPNYTGNGHCNQRGLTSLGETMVRKMMSRKVILDIDHLSAAATDSALTLVESQDYPVVAGHTGLIGVSTGSKKSEGQKPDEVVDRIRVLGGLIAPILHQGRRDEISEAPGSPVANDCGLSSRSWAQAYLYAVQKMGGAVGLGSDFNGLVQQPAPRFGPDACNGDKDGPQDEGTRISYPFTAMTGVQMQRNQIGGRPYIDIFNPEVQPRVFDYNEDGLAHIGLLPDFIEDLKHVGLTPAQLEPLFNSAEAYIRLWEKIESKNIFPPSSSFSQMPSANSAGWNNSDVAAVIIGNEHPDGWGLNIVYDASGAQPILETTATSSSANLAIAAEGVTTINFRSHDNAQNQEPSGHSATVKIDRTRPSLNCAGPDGLWHASEVSLPCTASDPVSGLALPADAAFFLTTSVPAGAETADAATGSHTVLDNAGNAAIAGPIAGNKIDRKSPVITISAPTTGTYALNQVVPANFSCVDGGSGVASCAGPVPSGAGLATTSVGLQLFTVDAADTIGNTSSQAVSYTVSYDVCLLYDPAKAKSAGSTIPIKLQLCDADKVNVSRADVAVTAVNVRQISTDAPGILEDAGSANPDNNFRFDSTVGGYIFNLRTIGLGSGTFALSFKAGGDPTTHTVQFQVK